MSKAIIQVGVYQSLVFDDALIHAVLEDMGGWVDLCSLKTEQIPFYANEFQKRYRGYLDKKPKRHPKYLWGITERENSKNGYEVKPPLLLGNAVKAQAVLETGGGSALLIQQSGRALSQLVLQISQSCTSEDDAKK